MENTTNTVTNKKAVLEQLVATNAKKASTIATQATTILVLSDKVKKLQLSIINKGVRDGRGGNSDNARKFLNDGYCWLHGYKVSHMVPDCNNKNEGHKYKDTHRNTTKGMHFN